MQKEIDRLGELIHDIDFAMLTTMDADGSLHSRPMSTQKAKFDGDLWFFTDINSAKVYEVDRQQHVNVSYADPSKQKYVSVSGVAQIVRDQAKAKELWNPIYKAWFPDGLEDPNLALMRVEVHKAEYWDSPSSKVVQLVGFVKAIATGERLKNAGEHEKVNL